MVRSLPARSQRRSVSGLTSSARAASPSRSPSSSVIAQALHRQYACLSCTAMAEAETEKRVAPLELFFDLVFVFALTQVTALMSDHPTWEGLGQGMLVLVALWWAWGAYAWLTNYIDADEGLERLLMFAVDGRLPDRGAGGAAGVRRRRADLRRRLRGRALAARVHLGGGQRRRGHGAGDRAAGAHGGAGAAAADRWPGWSTTAPCGRRSGSSPSRSTSPARTCSACAASACRPATSPSASP